MSLRFNTRVWGIQKNDVSADANYERPPIPKSPTQTGQSDSPKPECQTGARARGGTTNATPTLRETILNFIHPQKLISESTNDQAKSKIGILQQVRDAIYQYRINHHTYFPRGIYLYSDQMLRLIDETSDEMLYTTPISGGLLFGVPIVDHKGIDIIEIGDVKLEIGHI